MLNPGINTLLNIIAEKRTMADSNRDHRWCTAYNYLLRGLRYHRPARTMLGFGMSSFRRSTKLSWARRIAWLRRYCAAHDVQLARKSPNAYTEWSRTISRAHKMDKILGPVGLRIASSMRCQRRMHGVSAYSNGYGGISS